MTTIARCDHCQTTFRLNDRLVGKAVRCPRCGQVFRIALRTVGVQENPPAANTSTAVAPPIDESSDIGDFFAPPSPQDGYDAQVSRAMQRKHFRYRLQLVIASSLMVVLLGGAIWIAAHYGAKDAVSPVSVAPETVLEGPPLRGNWRPVSDSGWGITARFPDVPTKEPTSLPPGLCLRLDSPSLGVLSVEIFQQANPDWNEPLASISREEIVHRVPGGNLMRLSDKESRRVGRTVVHRFRLKSSDPRLSQNVAQVQKFSIGEKSVTALWCGPREWEHSPEISHFFNSVALEGQSYLLP